MGQGRQTRRTFVGKLVKFDRRGKPVRRHAVATGMAKILIFTGVRYQRDGTPVPAKPPRAARAKRHRG